MRVLGVIPARYASTRLRGKPLRDINGKTMLQRVWEQAKKSLVDDIVIATEDDIIEYEALSFGAKVFKNTRECQSGTERVSDVAAHMPEYGAYINIQGDEPMIDPEDINLILKLLNDSPEKVATLYTALTPFEAYDPNAVKLYAMSNAGDIVMFTRSPVILPGVMGRHFYKHIGIYGFSKQIISQIHILNEETENERLNRLEQLRWADNGIKFIGAYTWNRSIGVDTEQDLERVRNYFADAEN